MPMRLVVAVVAFAALVAAAPLPAAAQAGRSEINGTIFDTAKSVIPGATVTATHEATGLVRTFTSGADGRFVIATLTPGTYTIAVELAGFQTTTRQGVAVGVGQELTLDFTLSVAALQESLTVTAEAPVVEVTASRVGTNVTTREIDNLPSQGRNQLSLMQLVPGLTPSLQPGTFEGGQFNANGRETGSNMFMVDGVYNNDDRLGGSQGTQARVPLDVMAEFQVLTHQYTAEFGGSLRGRRQRGDQERHQQHPRPRLLLLPGRQPERDELLPEAPGRGESGQRQQGVGRQRRWARSSGTRRSGSAASSATNSTTPCRSSIRPRRRRSPSRTPTRPRSASWNTFLRGDYQMTQSNNLSVRWIKEAAITVGEDWEDELSTPDHWTSRTTAATRRST